MSYIPLCPVATSPTTQLEYSAHTPSALWSKVLHSEIRGPGTEYKETEKCKILCLQSDTFQHYFLSTSFHPLGPTTNSPPCSFLWTKQVQDIKPVTGNWKNSSVPVRTKHLRHDTAIKEEEETKKVEERKYKPLLTSLEVYGVLSLYHSFIHVLAPSGVRSVSQLSS
jgi:hypothetical protein